MPKPFRKIGKKEHKEENKEKEILSENEQFENTNVIPDHCIIKE